MTPTRLRDCIATNNGDDGFDIEGSHNELTSNTASSNHIGILIENDFNTLKQNTANSNDGGGIAIFGSVVGNPVTKNQAKENLVDDAFDENGECTSDQWKKNKFGTKDPACIR